MRARLKSLRPNGQARGSQDFHDPGDTRTPPGTTAAIRPLRRDRSPSVEGRHVPGTRPAGRSAPDARICRCVRALRRLVTRVCAMTFEMVARLIYDTPLARMSA